jgi:large subunit ribosomal protein L9
MKVYMLKDVENIGIAGQVVKVKEGHALNYLLPRKLAVKVTAKNEAFLAEKSKRAEVAAEAIKSKMGMLAERIKNMKFGIKKKVHDDGKLYGAVAADDIVALLQSKDVTINKKQVVFNKSVRSTCEHKVAIKLSSKLQPEITLTVSGEE